MYFVSALSNLKYKDDVSAERKHEATGESPHTLSASVLIKNKKNKPHRNDFSRGEQHGKSNIRENDALQICTLPPGPNLEARLYLMPHLFLFSCGKEDNNGSVALGVLACHLTAKGGHISEWCGWETTRSALHDWMARL